MPRKTKNISGLGLLLGSVILFAPVFAHAAGLFPEMMVGSTSATQDGKTIYGGMTGNYAVLNTDVNKQYGFNVGKIDPTDCTDAMDDSPVPNPACFFLGTGVGGLTPASSFGNEYLMSAQTLVNGRVAYEIPALFFGGVNIYGDASTDAMYQNNSSLSYLLKYWGTNLNHGNSDARNQAWQLGSTYVFNTEAQYDWGSDQFEQYHDKLQNLAGSGAVAYQNDLTSATPEIHPWSDSSLSGNSDQDKRLFPDGKVWTIDASALPAKTVTISSRIKYKGVGTIVVKGGNIEFTNGAGFIPGDSSSRLGIVVLKSGTNYGNCKFSGNNEVEAMVFCRGDMTVSGNGLFTGSFVADDFRINAAASVRFSYDQKMDDNQPPGFRNLIVPATKEKGNN